MATGHADQTAGDLVAGRLCPSLLLPTLHAYRCILAPPSGAVTPSGAFLPEGGLPWSLLLLKAGGAGL